MSYKMITWHQTGKQNLVQLTKIGQKSGWFIVAETFKGVWERFSEPQFDNLMQEIITERYGGFTIRDVREEEVAMILFEI